MPSVTKIITLVTEQLDKVNEEMKGDKKIGVSECPSTLLSSPNTDHSGFHVACEAERIRHYDFANSMLQLIVLVGGYGDSQYLNDALQKLCKEKGGIRLLCPPHPQAAIVKGAALRGLGNIVPSRRRCRRHCGISLNMVFREGIDPRHRANYDEWDGVKRCSGRMEWLISKGAHMDAATTIETSCEENWRMADGRVSTITLYSCAADRAPVYEGDYGKMFLAV